MRLSGAFPLNQAGSFPLTLPPGGYFYPPAGSYLIRLGSQSLIQWWDPVQSAWRCLSTPPLQTIQFDFDGYNQRIINASGVVNGASITNAGSGGTNGIGPTQTGTTISFGAAPTGGQAAKGYVIVGGQVGSAGGSATVTQAGSGFSVPPLILIDPPPLGGIQATAVAAITAGGAINTVTMVNPGAGYTSVPNFYVVPQFLDYPGQLALPYTIPASGLVAPNAPPGTIVNMPPQTFMQALQPAFPTSGGALITGPALAGSGTLTGIVVTDWGSAYTSVPTISFAGGGLAGGVAATALMSWCLTALVGSGGVGYTIGNTWISDDGLLSASTGIFNNDVIVPRPARGRLTATTGTLIIEDPGFGFQVALVAGNFGVAQGGTIATTTITFSGITMGGINDTSLLQAFVVD